MATYIIVDESGEAFKANVFTEAEQQGIDTGVLQVIELTDDGPMDIGYNGIREKLNDWT